MYEWNIGLESVCFVEVVPLGIEPWRAFRSRATHRAVLAVNAVNNRMGRRW